MAFCTSCGAEVVAGGTFCQRCGKPVSVAAGTPPQPVSPTSAPGVAAGLQDNIAGVLAYLFVPAIAFLIVEPYSRNRFVRFHSFQSILFAVLWMAVSALLGALSLLGLLLAPLVELAFLIVWIVCMLKAFQNQMFKLPVIGELAEKQAVR